MVPGWDPTTLGSASAVTAAKTGPLSTLPSNPCWAREELALLDSCDVLEPQITATLIDASAAMMDTLATQRGLDAEQSLALRKHVSDCDNTKSDLIGSSRHLERQLGYCLHAVVAFASLEEMLEDQQLQLMRIVFARAGGREEDREPIRESVLPLATEDG